MAAFRLQSVIALRAKKEEEAKILYAQEVRAHQHEVEHLNRLREDLQRRYLERRDTRELFLNEERILFIKESIENQKKRIAAAEKKMNHAHGFYLKKRQDREVVEKIKEKDAIREKQRMKKKEHKNLDSLYTMRFAVPDEDSV